MHLEYWVPFIASTRAQKQTLKLSSLVRLPYKEGPGHPFAIHPSMIHVCTFPMTLSAAWHASDLVPSPYELKQRPGLTAFVLCNANDVQDEQHVLFQKELWQ